MAIALEFINLIVPIATIRTKYPGGWEKCLADHADVLGGRVWHDEHLFRDGAMSPHDMKWLVDHWTELGLTPFRTRGGQRKWHDMCVVEEMFGGLTLDCDWLEINRKGDHVWLKGTSPGKIVFRDQSSEW